MKINYLMNIADRIVKELNEQRRKGREPVSISLSVDELRELHGYIQSLEIPIYDTETGEVCPEVKVPSFELFLSSVMEGGVKYMGLELILE